MIKVPKINTSEQMSVGSFFGMLFSIRDHAHLKHLNVQGRKAYEDHMALGEFYEELTGMIDYLIETYQGKYGIVNISIPRSSDKDPLEIVQMFVNELESNKIKSMFTDSWTTNQIDEMIALGYKTIYKLKNLN